MALIDKNKSFTYSKFSDFEASDDILKSLFNSLVEKTKHDEKLTYSLELILHGLYTNISKSWDELKEVKKERDQETKLCNVLKKLI